MAFETIQLPVRRISSSTTLDRMVLEVLPKDLAFAVDAIFANELREQQRLGNEPSNLIRTRWRNRAFFANKADIERAAKDLLATLERFTRVLTGRARASYKQEDRGDGVLIVGPLVPYTRKLYFSPLGSMKVQRKKIADIGDTRFVKVSIVPMHKLAIRAVKRKYPQLTIAEAWTNTEHGRTPGVYVGPKRKGALH